ncbi:MAG: UvrB/UvrC motif-containing protein [bacterium]
MKSQDLKKSKLPDVPGVYLFKKKGRILYIGKATSLKDRVKSYFGKDLISTRGPLLVDMVYTADKVDFIATPSVLEALILEASLIKKHQPWYNTKEKDNKSFNYIIITNEEFPRVLIERGRNIVGGKSFGLESGERSNFKESIRSYFGPYTNSSQLHEALKIVRKIFPFRDNCKIGQSRPCFNYQIGLCPGVCAGLLARKDYLKIISNIELFLGGKKDRLTKKLEKDMKELAQNWEFEKANKIKQTIFALNHIRDVSLIKSDFTSVIPAQAGIQENDKVFRIEAYDAAHLSGTNNVGVMVVMEDGELRKADYRKFIIKESRADDIAALKEMLERRLRHTEWPYPDVIVIDGGIAQLNMTKKVLEQGRTLFQVVAVTKDDRHKAKAIIGDKKTVTKFKKEILLINNEAHRFALAFHRKKRRDIIGR